MERGELAVMVAAISDSDYKDRLAKLAAAQLALDEREQEMQATAEHNAELLRQAAAEHAAAVATQSDLARLKGQLGDDTAGLASAIQSHNEETARFAEVRKTIEVGDAAKDAELTAREVAVTEREAAVEAGQAEQADREQKLMRGEQQMAAAHEAAQHFIEVFNGPLA